jgi:hypothetical protein
MLYLHRSTTAAVVSLSGAVIVTCNGTTDQRKAGAQYFQRDRTAQTRVLREILAVGWPTTCIMPLAYRNRFKNPRDRN